MKIQHSLLSFALWSVVVQGACGAGPEESSSAELELSYAGIREGNEAPAFDDPAVLEEERQDRETNYPDDPATAADANATRARPEVVSVVVTVRYGDLVERGLDGEGRWRLHVLAEGGLIHAVRQQLEDGEVGLLERIDRSHVAFGSAIRAGDSDGARLLIEYVPAAEGREGLVLETAGLRVALPLRELIDHRSIHASAQGEVAIQAYRRTAERPTQDPACRGGTLRARLAPLGDDGVGRVRGVLLNHDGEKIGHFRGAYGFRGEGEPVIFGKIITREGGAIARVRGKFERIDDQHALVRARIQVRAGRASGALRGLMVHRDGGAGRLEARWAMKCQDDSMPVGEDLGPETDDAERSRPTAE